MKICPSLVERMFADAAAEALHADPVCVRIDVCSSSQMKGSDQTSYRTQKMSRWSYRFVARKSPSAWKPTERSLYWITLVLSDRDYEEYQEMEAQDWS
jgi:hypothetical protein